MDSLVSHGHHIGLVDANDLSVDNSTVSAKKGRGKRQASMVIRRLKEARYMRQ
jgi:uncharacterized circularly permuted ATP-grasp superfamily protein